jgi:hypothetical protein
MSKDMYVYSAIPKGSKDLVKKHGLLSANAILKNPEVKSHIRPDKKELKLWEKHIRSRQKDALWDKTFQGPNVFFTPPDPDKIHDKHYIKKWQLEPIKINLSKLLKEQPKTIVHGQELIKYDKDKPETWRNRRGTLSKKQINKYLKTDPKKLWKHYNDSEGKRYASDVPHAAIITPSGKIDSKYIDFDQSWEWDKDLTKMSQEVLKEAIKLKLKKRASVATTVGKGLASLRPQVSNLVQGAKGAASSLGTKARETVSSLGTRARNLHTRGQVGLGRLQSSPFGTGLREDIEFMQSIGPPGSPSDLFPIVGTALHATPWLNRTASNTLRHFQNATRSPGAIRRI